MSDGHRFRLPGSKIALLGLCAVMALLTASCAEFANVYVNVKDQSASVISVHVYSAASGEYVGESPTTIRLRKYRGGAADTVSLLIRNDCRILGWQLVRIEKWAPSPAKAADATAQNNVLFVVGHVSDGCDRAASATARSRPREHGRQEKMFAIKRVQDGDLAPTR
jgi:hypothetical protein